MPPLRRLVIVPMLLDMRWWVHCALTAVMTWFCWLISQTAPTMVGPNWSRFREIADEPTWTRAFLVAAVIGLVGLVVGKPWVRLSSTFFLACAHGSVAILFYESGVTDGSQTVGLGVGSYGIYAGLGLLLLLRRLHDAVQNG